MALTRRGRLVVFLVILLLVLGLPAAGGYLFLSNVGLIGDSRPGREVEVVIPKGSSSQEIGSVLAESGVIESTLGWRIAVYLDGGAEEILAGKYRLPTGLTPRDALAQLLEERPQGEKFTTVTFPEGSWIEDFARILDENTHISGKDFTQVVESGKVRSKYLPEGESNLEGLLFPSTYQIVEKEDALSFTKRMVEEFERQFDSVDTSTAKAMGYTPYEMIIVASMVEAEAAVDEDRGKIARVIYNRLEQGTPLGIDATVLYALGEHKAELTVTDLAIDSPYNTRVVAGLPPGPIGAPGLASLQAAANPPEGDWFFFVVSDCEGHHAFSETNEEFLEDKAHYQTLDC